MNVPHELKEIDELISLNYVLLVADPEGTKPASILDSAKDEIDSLLDARLLLMQILK